MKSTKGMVGMLTAALVLVSFQAFAGPDHTSRNKSDRKEDTKNSEKNKTETCYLASDSGDYISDTNDGQQIAGSASIGKERTTGLGPRTTVSSFTVRKGPNWTVEYPIEKFKVLVLPGKTKAQSHPSCGDSASEAVSIFKRTNPNITVIGN